MTQDRYLQVSGARLRYRDDGEGHAVVLIHGWTLNLEMWDPQVSALAGSYRVVRFDRRGCGLSSGVPGVESDAEDVLALCRHLGITRSAFVGMSRGARVLERLTAVAPELISCLVFDGAPEMRPDGMQTSNDIPIAEYAAIVRTQGVEAFRQRWAAHPLTRLVTTDPQMHELLSRMLARYQGNDLRDVGGGTRGGADGAAGAAGAAGAVGAAGAAGAAASTGAAAARTQASAQLAAASTAASAPRPVPVLILNGALDLDTRRRAGAALMLRIPTAEHAIVPHAAHLPNLDNSVAYNEILLRFLAHAAAV